MEVVIDDDWASVCAVSSYLTTKYNSLSATLVGMWAAVKKVVMNFHNRQKGWHFMNKYSKSREQSLEFLNSVLQGINQKTDGIIIHPAYIRIIHDDWRKLRTYVARSGVSHLSAK